MVYILITSTHICSSIFQIPFQVSTRRAEKILTFEKIERGQYDPIRDAELFRVFSKPNTLARVFGFCRGGRAVQWRRQFPIMCYSFRIVFRIRSSR